MKNAKLLLVLFLLIIIYPINTISYDYSLNSSSSRELRSSSKSYIWCHISGFDVQSVAISLDGQYITSGRSNGRVSLFNRTSSTPLWDNNTDAFLESVAISSDGTYIVTGTYDSEVFLFNRSNSIPDKKGSTEVDEVFSVAISSDGQYFIAGANNPYVDSGRIHLFNRTKYPGSISIPPERIYGSMDRLNSVSITSDGMYIVAGSEDYYVYLFNRTTSALMWKYFASLRITSVAISSDGNYIVAGAPNKVYLFNRSSSTPLWNYTFSSGNPVTSIAISSDGQYFVTGNGEGGEVCLFNRTISNPLWNYLYEDVESIAISSDGKYIVVGHGGWDPYSGWVRFLSRASSTPLWSFDANPSRHTNAGVQSVAISSDGQYIVAGTQEGHVFLFDKEIPPSTTLINDGDNGDNDDEDNDQIIPGYSLSFIFFFIGLPAVIIYLVMKRRLKN